MQNIYAHSLVDLLRGICNVPAALDTRVSGISIDSRKVQKGDVFIAIASDEAQLELYVAEAIERGANAVLRDGNTNCRIYEDKAAIEICLQGLRQSMGEIAARFFFRPSEEIKVIGVTGTNGKTSVANYLASYISQGPHKCGVMGTLGYGLLGEETEALVATGYTTPDVIEVHRHLANMRDAGAKFVVMEVSSHGLCQNRVDGVQFYGAVFTNLTRDHLDYHGSMSDYAQAKQKLFQNTSLAFAVLNRDDDLFSDFKAAVTPGTNITSYAVSSKAADVAVLTNELSSSGIHALIKASVGQVMIDSPLLGEFNLSNLLAVLAAATAMNDLESVESRVKKIKAVDGRMEVLRSVNQPTVVVDYAHTPDALENVLKTLAPLCSGSLRVIFGCGGDRDQGKRAEMARVAEALADDIVLSDDNPRGESPEAIIADILAGFAQPSKVEVIHERRMAIQKMLEKSVADDVILVAGKGHETWQEVKGQRHYFSDIETVRELISGAAVLPKALEEVIND
ncbi:hypothetical protein A3749_00190 [Oleiphilus sp. HI0078]|uniref:UDP-N-acetylmuramoyl-L-alanyl-D-glutamate--2, 6-diaminopimelate ligase n=3 Tax=Oleiphilus TaxID=141450 RepID=UPI0007C22D2F|nr:MULTISPECIES: UDP-N-acetylmuramoyl-L-alanyl-D-glutamate--2,6-diaminopimelate ligase [unclassified Oleiphilus]KZY39332.1 hypothetical protein A3729_02635 [Oleiphilus sp. HI0043]KZZ09454.1 hypothetical protein A3749_00190 [Oleiphilus sp. HI0078]KZZ68195.1 hypothetical protein A3763_01770 [Oleiphilus sp. HI0128]